MDAPEYVRMQMSTMRRLCDGALQGLTDEQFNWIPPGSANSIKASLIHLIAGEDMHVQQVLQGKPPLWESEGWGERIGLTTRPGRDQGWAEIKEKTLALAPVLEYVQAVRTATDEYLERLTPQELERPVEFFIPNARVATVLSMLVAHEAAHSGEIAALRGVQGVKGLPF